MVSRSSLQLFRLSWDFWTIFKNLIKIIVLVNLSAPAGLAAAAEFTRKCVGICRIHRENGQTEQCDAPERTEMGQNNFIHSVQLLVAGGERATLLCLVPQIIRWLCCDAKKNSNFVVLFIFRYASEWNGQKKLWILFAHYFESLFFTGISCSGL